MRKHRPAAIRTARSMSRHRYPPRVKPLIRHADHSSCPCLNILDSPYSGRRESIPIAGRRFSPTRFLSTGASGSVPVETPRARRRAKNALCYEMLERTQKGDLDITPWLEWFLGCLDRAFDGAEKTLAAVFRKAEFWKKHAAAAINERQRDMLTALAE